MNKIIIFFLIICVHMNVVGQKKNATFNQQVNLNEDKYLIKTYIAVKFQPFFPDTGLIYSWFENNKIYQNKGGYSGNPLNGIYQKFNRDGDMIEEGEFKMGVKNGNWILWGPSGKISEYSQWKNGKLWGNYTKYDPDGTINKNLSYKDGKLNGTCVFFINGKPSEQYYEEGTIVADTVKNKKNMFHRFSNIFKKKKSKKEDIQDSNEKESLEK